MGAQAQRTEVQRTRGPNLAVLVAYANKVPSEEGLRLANEGNLVVASNKRLDKALVGSDEWQQPNVRPALPAWTGTYAGYEEVGKKLGKTIEYVDSETGFRHVFPVPEQYQGQKNVILVAEHPDYSLERDGNNRVVNATKVDGIQAFPGSDGWYPTDAVHGIPTGNSIDSSNAEARYLWRIAKRVAPVARDCYNFNYNRRLVALNYRPSNRLGVAVEAADANVAAATLRPLTDKLVASSDKVPIVAEQQLGGQSGGSAPLEGVAPVELKLTRESPDTLIIKGTPAQLDAAVKLLDALRQQ